MKIALDNVPTDIDLLHQLVCDLAGAVVGHETALSENRIETERATRPVALGGKNSLFSGSDGGADRWAILASLIETAKLTDVGPYA